MPSDRGPRPSLAGRPGPCQAAAGRGARALRDRRPAGPARPRVRAEPGACAAEAGRARRRARPAERAFAIDPRQPVACALWAHCLMEASAFAMPPLPAQPARRRGARPRLPLTLGRALQRRPAARGHRRRTSTRWRCDMTTPTVHYQLGMCFNDLGMKEEAAQCFQTALALGRPHELGVRAAAGVLRARGVPLGRRRARPGRAAAALAALPADAAVPTAPFAHVTLLDDPLEQLKAARAPRAHVAPGPARCPPRTRRRTTAASARGLRVGRLPHPCDQQPDGRDAGAPRSRALRGDAVLARPGRRQRHAPAHRGGVRALRRPARAEPDAIASASARTASTCWST